MLDVFAVVKEVRKIVQHIPKVRCTKIDGVALHVSVYSVAVNATAVEKVQRERRLIGAVLHATSPRKYAYVVHCCTQLPLRRRVKFTVYMRSLTAWVMQGCQSRM